MNNEAKNGMACSEFEALLADALDNAIAGESRTAFDEHGRSCAVCGPMLADALEGMVMVRGLAELEPPKNLVHNILAATSRKEATAEQI
ncbi:MAG TPA: zf-HC2 domain-containing protein, partial [Blattabacteriaceae bacterium]|nr:zf-HC2 domain-containing protein [Blattabacteriaceae bacterium]